MIVCYRAIERTIG
ncbi:hypothetical protein D037_0773A, partial [Vibrio parahaemolyticus IDH02640]